MNLMPIKINSFGFTLIEILLAIGILALIGAVAFPNLRNFSSNQDIEATTSSVVNILKNAQSSASSRIQCPRGEVTDTWIVRLNLNNYSLIARCQTSGDQIVTTQVYSPSANDTVTTFKGSTDVCPSVSTDIIFSKNTVTYLCSGSATAGIGTVNVTIANTAGSLSKVIKVEPGGVIKVE